MAAACGCEEQKPAQMEYPTASLSTPIHETSWGKEGICLQTPHYKIYTTIEGRRIDVVLPGFMESAYHLYEYLTNSSPNPDYTLPMYMLASRQEWAIMTQKLFGNIGPDNFIENGGYTYRGVTVCYDIGGMNTFSVAAHEGLHQYLWYFYKNRLPLWAEEGLATQCEGFITTNTSVRFTPQENMMRFDSLRTAIKNNDWLPIEKLLVTTSRKQLGQGELYGLGYYGQLYVLVRFIRNHKIYGPRWAKMLDDAKNGKFSKIFGDKTMTLSPAAYYQAIAVKSFRHYINPDLQAFEREFHDYAQKVVIKP